MSEESEERKIHVRVSFPISKKGAYEAEDHRKTTVSTVLAAAMEHFKVQDDSQFTYVLAFDGRSRPAASKSDPLPETTTRSTSPWSRRSPKGEHRRRVGAQPGS